MSNNDVKIRPYPQPNPNVDGSASRFAVAVDEVVENGVKRTKDKLQFVIPFLPVCDFVQDRITGKWNFVQKLDDDGEPIAKPGRRLDPYIPSAELIELVRLAQVLQRPIFIKGEPGSGKTQLAKSVAYEWYGDDYKKHFFEWQIKSTSKAVDGLYTFDHLARLRDAQIERNKSLQALEKDIPPSDEKKEDLRQYRKFGPMGQAFLTSTAEKPSILLIDEIDKAEIDFPNDLLRELDEGWFSIPASETGEVIEAEYPPLIFITSNDEREMPEAFLRRCLFLFVEFPEDTLVDIIRAHMPRLVEAHPRFVQAAVDRFKQLRKDIKEDPADTKRVSTSELLDWLQAFYHDLENGGAERPEAVKNLPVYYHAILKTYAALNREKKAVNSSAK